VTLNSYCGQLTENSPSAFELYADLKGQSESKTLKFFKGTFSQVNVKVHFLGAWYVSSRSACLHKLLISRKRDTVSSVGLIRGRNLPKTDEFNSSICYFRHALVLDERHVKYLPEYVCGGMSMTEQREHNNVCANIFIGYAKEFSLISVGYTSRWWQACSPRQGGVVCRMSL
jgi:hypothetical protein